MSAQVHEPAAMVPTVDEHGAKVQRMFGRIAHGYDRANRVMSLGIDVRWRRRAVADLVPEGTREPVVLDLCAGTMDGSVEIHRRHPHARIVAGDFSAEMLAAGATKLRGAAASRIEPRTMDAHALPLAGGELDAIFCAFGVRNLSDLARATAEQARCLRAGGRLVVLEFFRPTRPLSRLLYALYCRTALPMVGWALTGDLDAYTYLPRSIGAFDDVDTYMALLREHGFVDVRAEPLTLGIAWIVRATRGGTAT